MVNNINGNNSNGMWTMILWLLGSMWAPIAIPWVIYQMITYLHQKYKRTYLAGKVVFITGASSGLGEALAHAFYNAGCKVILSARRKEELERVRHNLLETHMTIPTHPPVVLPLDLSEIESFPEAVSHILSIFDRIDILVNNGGISFRADVVDTSIEVDKRIMLVNYFGQIALTKAVLPSMIKHQSGHIVAISSIQGRIALPYRSAYTASKHALQAFCDALRAEVQPNIKVTVVNPGYIKTSLSLNALTGSGNLYGKMDDTTAKGYSAEYVANQIIKSISLNQSEITIAPLNARVAIILRTLTPSLYFWIMARRAKKTELNQ